MNDPSTEQRSGVAKTRWDILEGPWSCPKSLSTPSRARKWMKMLATICKSSATAVGLRAVLRLWANFLHTLDIIKTTDAVLSSIPRNALSTLTPECVPHWRSRRTQVQVWIAFDFTGRSFSCSCIVSSTVLYSVSCRRLYGVTSLFSEAKMGTKSSPDDDEEVLQVSEAIIRCIKWSNKCLLKRRGLKMARFFELLQKPPFPDLFLVDRCVNDVTWVCRSWIEAALQPPLTTHSSKTRRRMDFGLVAFFQSKTALAAAKVSFLDKLPL